MVEVGDIGLMMYSGDHYILVPLTDAIPGERGLIVPLANNEYRVVKLASSALVGDRVVVVHDRRGNYWAISSEGPIEIISPEDPEEPEEPEDPEEPLPEPDILIAGDGSGDYNCDGIDDQIEINLALLYAKDHPGTIVHLKGPFTYVISDSLFIYSNTILQGDETACLTVPNNCGWPKDKALIRQNSPTLAGKGKIIIRGFEINGGAEGNTSLPRGQSYLTLAWLYYDDIEFYNMYLHDGLNDGLKIFYSESVKFYDNIVYKLGHDVVFAYKSNNVLFYNNNVRTKTNAAIRFYNSNGKAYDNFIWTVLEQDAGGPGIQIQYTRESTATPMTDIEIYHNTFKDCYGPGIWLIGTGDYEYEAWEANGVHIHHNIFYGCGAQSTYEWLAGITLSGFYNTLIEYNTFDACYNAAVSYIYPSGVGPHGDTIPYNTTVRNNIMTNMLLRKASPSGTGQAVQNNYPESASFLIQNNCCYGNAGTNYVNCSATGDVLSGPLFVDRANHDYHLQAGSPAAAMGRYAGE